VSIDQSRIGLRGPSLRAASLPARVVSIDQSRIGLRGGRTRKSCESKRL